MLIDQIRPIISNEVPRETVLRIASLESLRMFVTRVEHAYANAKPGTVLLPRLCDDITLMIPVESKRSLVVTGSSSDGVYEPKAEIAESTKPVLN